jgi:hypothetical protein
MRIRHSTPTLPSTRRIGTGAFLILALAAGCHREPEKTVVAKGVAPTPVTKVAAATLPTVKFVDISKAAGIDFVHENAAQGEKLLPETMGSGVAFLDFDGDGDQDLFFVNSMPWPGKPQKGTVGNRLYRNDGKGKFTEVTEAAGLARTLFGMGVAVGDYDNDGDPDLYVTALDGGVLYRNEGGKFTDVTKEANAQGGAGWQTSAGFFDIENDGDLDLFICRYVDWSKAKDEVQTCQLAGAGRGYCPPSAFGGSFCTLLRNDGGRFVDISEASGIQIRTPDHKVPVAKSLGVAPFDIDGDGLVDLAVANDTVPNFLFHNLGHGKFEEIGTTSGIAFDSFGGARGAMGIDWAYFKNDRSLGLAIGNFANEMTALYVADQPQKLLFSDQANVFGLGAPTQPPLKFGLFFFDYDLDGRLDVLSTNGHLENDIAKVQASQTYEQPAQLFWNTGQKRRMLFALVGPTVAGPDLFTPIVGRGSAYADIDGDGDLDVVFTANGGPARLFRNDGGDANKWIRLELVGRDSNRSGIGAKVRVKVGDVVQERQHFPARGYLSTVEMPLTFGLAGASRVDMVRITWPSGKTTELKDLAAGQVYKVDEAAGIVK